MDDTQRLLVYVRVRPKNHSEIEEGSAFDPLFEELADDHVSLVGGKTYKCDGLLDPSDQSSVFHRVAMPAVDLALDGYAAGLMCYGQTGTGKTFTMCNDSSVTPDIAEGDEGLIPRTAKAVFRPREGSSLASVSLQAVQIYRDQLQDLLGEFPTNFEELESDSQSALHTSTEPKRSDLRYDEKTGVELLNVSKVNVSGPDGFMEVFRHAMSARTTCATKMNANSSRSHVAIVAHIHTTRVDSNGERTDLHGKLVLVDLAGYERFTLTDLTEEKHKDEARTINASLLALGNVIQALSQRQQHVPWRNAKLTRLMQDCVGGKSRTAVILTVGPSNEHEHATMGTLFFGARAMNVVTTSTRDATVDFEQRAERLQRLLDAANERIDTLEDEKAEVTVKMGEMEASMQDEISLLQEQQMQQLIAMIERGDAPERIKKCLASYTAELNTVLEQQQQERAYNEGSLIRTLEDAREASMSFAHNNDPKSPRLVVPFLTPTPARGSGAYDAQDSADRGRGTGSSSAANNNDDNAEALQEELDDVRLELSIEQGISRDLRQKLAEANERITVLELNLAEFSTGGASAGPAAGVAASPQPQQPEANASPSGTSPNPRANSTMMRQQSSPSFKREESISAIISRIQEEKRNGPPVPSPQLRRGSMIGTVGSPMPRTKLKLDSPEESEQQKPEEPPAADAAATAGSSTARGGSIKQSMAEAIAVAATCPLDRFQRAQVLRRHMIELQEAQSATKIFLAFSATMARAIAPSVQRGINELTVRLDNLPSALVRQELVLEETFDDKWEMFCASAKQLQGTIARHAAGKGSTEFGTPTRSRSGSQASSTADVAPSGGKHRVVAQQPKDRPEAHRLMLMSGRSIEGEKQRLAGVKLPPVRSDVVRRQALQWKSNELTDCRKMLGFNVYFLGDSDVGKTSVIHCMTNKTPKWRKKAPQVATPTLRITRTHHEVPVVKLPGGDIPRGGIPTGDFDPVAMTKNASDASQFHVRLTELPMPYLRATKKGGLPSRGAAYFLCYDMRDIKTAKETLWKYLRHIHAVTCLNVASSASASTPNSSRPSTPTPSQSGAHAGAMQRIPIVLLGTHRDAVPAYNVEDDESAVLAALREMRDWFGHKILELKLLRKQSGDATPAESEFGFSSMPILVDSFAVSVSNWSVIGERPRSATNFEDLLKEAVEYLAVHSPIAPDHLLPTLAEVVTAAGGDREEAEAHAGAGPRSTASLTRFWDTALALQGGPPPIALFERWLRSAGFGVVTLMTALARYSTTMGTVVDGQTFDNLLIQHFALTMPTGGAGLTSPNASFIGSPLSGANNTIVAGTMSSVFAEEPTTNELIMARDAIVEHFMNQCTARGIFVRVETAPGFWVVLLNQEWYDAVYTPLLMPAVINYAASTGEAPSSGARHVTAMLGRTRSLGVTLDGAATAELQFYGLGYVSQRYLQSTMSAPLDAISATYETSLMALTPINLTQKEVVKRESDSRRHRLLRGASKNDFYVPAVAHTVPSSLFNFIAFALHTVSDECIDGVTTLGGAPLSYFPQVCLRVLSMVGASSSFTWQTGMCFTFHDDIWVMICINEKDDGKVHLCLASPMPTTTVPLSVAHEALSSAFDETAALYPSMTVSHTSKVAKQAPPTAETIQFNVQQLLSSSRDRNVVDRTVSLLQQIVEHTVKPALDEVVLSVLGNV